MNLQNQTRARYSLPGFCVHPSLHNAARAHSAEMIAKDYFSHNSYNGESFSNRL
ncbi:MAG TPA: CAP domain-containing protein [Rubrobacteraceae bacterium]|nr:CAP domain-containing protein [Rubrobacteraceae bacterium]